MTDKSIEQLEAENRMIRLQLEEIHEKEHDLCIWLAENEWQIADQLKQMEEYEDGSCDLCMGSCDTQRMPNDGAN